MAVWITDRLPTEADADADGEVIIRRDSELRGYMHWSYVVPSQPWLSPHAAARGAHPTPAPAPARVVTALAAQGLAIYAACNDGTIWTRDAREPAFIWQQLPSIPQPEATDD